MSCANVSMTRPDNQKRVVLPCGRHHGVGRDDGAPARNGLQCAAVTSTHDRRSDLDAEPSATPWTERPIVGASRGLPWWGAVLLPFALSAIGAVVDIERSKTPGVIFQGVYLVTCVIAVCWVRRRSIFGPTVQPPLILVITVPLVVLLAAGTPEGGGA